MKDRTYEVENKKEKERQLDDEKNKSSSIPEQISSFSATEIKKKEILSNSTTVANIACSIHAYDMYREICQMRAHSVLCM